MKVDSEMGNIIMMSVSGFIRMRIFEKLSFGFVWCECGCKCCWGWCWRVEMGGQVVGKDEDRFIIRYILFFDEIIN